MTPKIGMLYTVTVACSFGQTQPQHKTIIPRADRQDWESTSLGPTNDEEQHAGGDPSPPDRHGHGNPLTGRRQRYVRTFQYSVPAATTSNCMFVIDGVEILAHKYVHVIIS